MAPDLGTNEQIMAWFMDTYSMYQGVTVPEIVTGKPVGSGGTLGRREATGHGVAFLAFRALERLGIEIEGATGIVQGFGNVGSHAALGLASRGVKIVGLSDHTIALHDPSGFDVHAAAAYATNHGVLRGFADAAAIDPPSCLHNVAMSSRRVQSSESSTWKLQADYSAQCLRRGQTVLPHPMQMLC